MEVNLICIWLTLELGISDALDSSLSASSVVCAPPSPRPTAARGGVGGWSGGVVWLRGSTGPANGRKARLGLMQRGKDAARY